MRIRKILHTADKVDGEAVCPGLLVSNRRTSDSHKRLEEAQKRINHDSRRRRLEIRRFPLQKHRLASQDSNKVQVAAHKTPVDNRAKYSRPGQHIQQLFGHLELRTI
jgi:hypothetical protein